MTKKAATTKTADAPAEAKTCRCGCGAPVNFQFIQGHDQRLISQLAHNTATGDGRCMGILTADEAKGDIQARIDKVTAYIAEKLSAGLAAKYNSAAHRQWDLSVRQDNRQATRAERVAKAAAKTAHRAKRAANPAGKKVATAPATPDPFDGVDEAIGDHPRQGNLATITKAKMSNEDVDVAEAAESEARMAVIGTPVRVVVGRRKRNANVHGINQAGKVTAVKLVTNGRETIKTEGEFTVLGNL
jgi:hypothetical protein